MIAAGKRLRIILAAAAVIAGAAGITWSLIPPFRSDITRFASSSRIVDRKGRTMRVIPDVDGRQSYPISLERTGDWTAMALVAGEDKRFYTHGGVDPVAVCRAAYFDLVSGKIVSGASTITMLVGKLAEPRPRNLWTKIVEAQHALYLEKHLSKDEILGQYLNRAPFGGNIVGIEAAAQRYFGRSAADLSLAEAALLAGLPQSPSRLRPDLHPEAAAERRKYILEKMRLCGFITEAQFAEAEHQDVLIVNRPNPQLAPHFCDLAAARRPRMPVIATSLDLDIQRRVELALRTRLNELQASNIHSGAAIVLDVKSGGIIAMVGSPDFSNVREKGQVNCAVAKRSPGSTLKPFIYAMAMDEGLCSPESIILDEAVSFSGYNPKNFNGEFSGTVSVRQALVQSLNIPALLYVQKVGLENLTRTLRTLGFSTLEQRADHYGLSVAIGTCEVTLLDLANAYACLARLGIWREASFTDDVPSHPGKRIFSAEAAYMISDILSGDERAADADGHVADVKRIRVAWKTGTSSGNRDAWCIAYNPEYVVGVWLGNPDGKGAPALTGSSTATPLATGIFKNLYPGSNAPWFERPQGLTQRRVCKSTGLVACKSCTETEPGDCIPDITPVARCPGHRQAEVKAEPKLKITSPLSGETFHLLPDVPSIRQEVSLETTPASDKHYWFVDGKLYGTAEAGERINWPLSQGRHSIVCCDGTGRGDRVEIVVE